MGYGSVVLMKILTSIIVILTILALLPYGCNYSKEPEPIKVVERTSIQGNKEASEFILQCAKNSNPMSDEEPEDMLEACRTIAGEIYGKKVYNVYSFERGNYCYSDSANEARKCAKDSTTKN